VPLQPKAAQVRRRPSETIRVSAPRVRPALVLALAAGAAAGARAQPVTSRAWRPDERTLVTDLSHVTAVAATDLVVYAATRQALAVYDRGSGALREVVGVVDGYPPGPVSAMVADPGDDTAWLAGLGLWVSYEPLGRRIESGPLPGPADEVVLDRSDPSRGAFFHTSAGWYLVPRVGLFAQPAGDVPPPGRRIAALGPAELLARAPAFDAVRMRIERDAQLRTWRLTSAVMTPARNEVFVGTDGNGVFRVDLTTYDTERFPAGLLATPTGAVTVGDGLVCAGSDAHYRGTRRGITCFRPDLSDFRYFEGASLAGLPAGTVRRLLPAAGALWVAGDAGALRIDPRSGDVRQLLGRAGLPSDDVRALAAAPGGVWIGTARGLAFVPDTGATPRATSSLVLDAAVLALAVQEDTLWVGTAAGLFVLPPGAGSPVAAAPDRPDLAAPILALAVKGDTLLAATDTRLAWRVGSAWHVLEPPGASVGRLTALAADRDGFWVAGSGGLAFYQPARGLWRALTAPGDVPQPVSDVAAGRDYVWAATPGGVVRLDRRVLVP
jgi:ligand-binding sensor domain-containing protein